MKLTSNIWPLVAIVAGGLLLKKQKQTSGVGDTGYRSYPTAFVVYMVPDGESSDVTGDWRKTDADTVYKDHKGRYCLVTYCEDQMGAYEAMKEQQQRAAGKLGTTYTAYVLDNFHFAQHKASGDSYYRLSDSDLAGAFGYFKPQKIG